MLAMPQAFDWSRAVMASRGNLPHIRQQGCIYYVTFRLNDSVPQTLIRQWREEARLISQTSDANGAVNHTMRRLERYLDRGMGTCILRDPAVAAIVTKSLHDFDGDRYLLDEFVVMPNHVHVLIYPIGDHTLDQILNSCTSFTTTCINKLLNQRGTRVWQDEPFDHAVRDTAHLNRIRQYIRRNPGHLADGSFVLGRGRFTDMLGF